MLFFLKFGVYFTLSFLILCIPINNKQLFNHIYVATSPYVSKVFAFTKEKAALGLNEGKKITEKLFSNSLPKGQKDSVTSGYSGVQKVKAKIELEVPSDSYTVEEEALLKRILKEQSAKEKKE